MTELFHLGGWGMYPTTIAGLVLVFVSLQFARNPDARRLQVARSLGVLTLLVGVLGFVMGVIRSFTAVPPGDDAGTVALMGTGESLANLGLALVALVIGRIATTIGLARGTATPRADLIDPMG